MKRIIAQARKELTQLLRDRLSLALALVLPLVLLFLFGVSISFSVTGLKVVVQDLDQSRSPASTLTSVARL
jgi:ABC-2 type transport system permease protein